MADITTVGILGAGTMGSGIAHVFARSGFQVLLCDVEQRFLDRALTQIRANLGREAAKGKIAESDIEPAIARIRPSVSRESLAEAEIAIEAAPERFDLKAEIFRSLDAILPRTPSLPATLRRSRSPNWGPSHSVPLRSSACTSSIPCR